MLSDLHFIRPEFFWLFGFLGVLLWFAYRKNRSSNSWLQVCDPQLVSHLLVGNESKKSFLPLILLFIAGSLLIIAVAGPAWQKLPQPVYKNESARVFVLDLSPSMDATDVSPSRITRAKLKLIDFLKSQKEGQVGLVAFAGEPFIVSPLTNDSNTIVSMVPDLSTSIMPVPGSSPAQAILKAAQLLKQAGSATGDIVLITDGVDKKATLKAAKKIVAQNYKLDIVGVGTLDGAPVPDSQGGFLTDKNGAIVIPKLNPTVLKEVALAGGGLYTPMTVDDSDIKKIATHHVDTKVNGVSKSFRKLDLWKDEGTWFVLLALPFVALGFRRGWLGMIILTMTLSPVDKSMAFGWKDLWQTRDQQAQQAFKEGRNKQAAKLFNNESWKGTAYYRDGDYKKAEQAFSKQDDVQSKYNLANALARQGRFEEAIKQYDDVLAKDPGNKDALFNRNLVKKALQQQKNQENKSGNQKQSKNQQNKQNQNSKDQKNQSSPSQQNSKQQQSNSTDKNQQKSRQDEAGQKQVKKDQAKQQDEKQKQAQQEQSQKDKPNKKDEKLSQQQQAEKNKKQAKKAEKQKPGEENKELNNEQKEMKQATQQWLRRIPDDPGGLLREKFYRKSLRERQERKRLDVEQPW